VPESDSVYESGDIYTSDSEQSCSPVRNAIPSRLYNPPPPLPPDADRAPLSRTGGTASPQDRMKLAEPPTVKKSTSDSHSKKTVLPPFGKSRTLHTGQTATLTVAFPFQEGRVEDKEVKPATVVSSKGKGGLIFYTISTLHTTRHFCRPTQCVRAACAMATWLCGSVSVTLMYCAQTTESIIMRPSRDCSPAILVFPHQI